MTFCRNEIFQKNKQNKYLFRTFKHKPDCPSLDFIQPWQGLPPCLYHDLSMRLKGTIKTQVITDFKACRPVKLCRTSDKGPFIYTHPAIIYFSHSDRLFCASAVPHSTFPVDFFLLCVYSCICLQPLQCVSAPSILHPFPGLPFLLPTSLLTKIGNCVISIHDIFKINLCSS